jgi:hypothetical protein
LATASVPILVAAPGRLSMMNDWLRAAQQCPHRRLEHCRRSSAPAAMDSSAPLRCGTPPAARQRLRRDAEIDGAEVSDSSWCSPPRLVVQPQTSSALQPSRAPFNGMYSINCRARLPADLPSPGRRRPPHATTRIHHPFRRRGGSVAGRGARTAVEAADHRLPSCEHGCDQ